MRAILGIILVLVILALVGWVTFDTNSSRPSATIETEKIEADVDRLSNAASAAVEEAGDSVDDAVEDDNLN